MRAMSVLDVLSAARDLGRLHDIASVLVRHGLGDLVRTLGLAGLLERAGRALHWEAAQRVGQLTTAERVRAAFEELGPTFVKFGQLLASRADLVPDEWVTELSKLQESVEPVPWTELRAQLEEDLGAPPESIWPALDTAPLAAGSIAQVHRAELISGEEVVLKVRRPGIRAVVEADLRLLARLAELVESQLPDLRRYRPKKVVRSFGRTMRDEPSVGKWLTTGEPADLDGPATARAGADALLRMVFVHGFFHADPHPGNLLLLADGRIGLIDCGMVGRLSDARRGEFVALLLGAVRREERAVVDALMAWTEDEDTVDQDQLSSDARALIDRYYGAALDQVRMSDVLHDVLSLVRDNGLYLPTDVSSLLRVLMLLDGVGRELDPDFDLTSHVRPFAERLVRDRGSWRRALVRQARDIGALVSDAPRDLREILSKARRGRFRLDLDMKRLDEFAIRLDHSANRMTMGLVTSALIVGTSIALTTTGGPRLLGLPAFALLGFTCSTLLGIGVVVSIWRSGRR
jgi:ubiquinone biosynthesis protein